MKSIAFVIVAIACGPLTLHNETASGGDWPQILGPNRSGVADDEQLLDKWPQAGPKLNWSKEVGLGFAGLSVRDDRAVLFHRIDDKEVIESIDVANGKTIWKTEFPTDYRARINPDTGPRCVPTIEYDQIIAFGAGGNLHCTEFSSGKKLWSRNLFKDYRSDEGYFGAGSSPVVVDGHVLVNCGNGDGAGVIAISLDNGETIWQATDEAASYSSPVIANIDDERYAIFVTRLNLVGLQIETGEVAFRIPFGESGPTVNAATPLIFDETLFVTASYRIGARLFDIKTSTPKLIWGNDASLSSQYATPVVKDGYLYGTDGREDVGQASFRCVLAATGEVLWSADRFGVSHVILVGDQLVLWKVDGTLVIAKATPEAFRETQRWKIFDGDARALPALADGKLFVRSNAEQGWGELRCLQVGEP